MNIVHFSEFKFDTLRKYMMSVYAALNQQIHIPLDQKESFVQISIVPQFYQRMRTYRGLSLEEIVAKSKSKISVEELLSFERGEMKMTPQIDLLYCSACGGDNERIYFYHQIRAFYQPSIRESEIALAKEVLVKTGLKSAYVDYKNLNAEKGKVLEFPNRSLRD